MQGQCTIINQLGRDVYFGARDQNLLFLAWGSSLVVDTKIAFTVGIPNRWISPYLTIPDSFKTVYLVRGIAPDGMVTPESDFGAESSRRERLTLVNTGDVSYVRHARSRFQTDDPRRITCEDGKRVEVNIADQAGAGNGFFRLTVPGTMPDSDCELIQDLSGWAKLLILALVLVAAILIVGSSVYIVQR